MAKLIFFNLPAYGHINPTLELVSTLVQSGEEVFYYAGEDFQEVIEGTSASFRAYPIKFPYSLITISENIFRSALMLMRYTHEVLPLLLEEVKQIAPDYIMHDSLCIWGKVVARQLRIPAITSSAIMHPAVAGSGYKWPLANLMWRMLWKGKAALIPYFYLGYKLSRNYSMPFYSIPQAYINRGILNICYTSTHFHPSAQGLGKDYLLIGPPASPAIDASPFPFEKLQNRTVIYISLGTVVSAGQIEFYRMCFEAFQEMDAIIILSTAAFKELDQLAPVPENFIVRSFAPQPLLMPYLDVFVSHGGMNSIHDAMAHEVPLLIIPQTFEQTLNGLRIEEVGAGLMLRPEKVQISTQTMQEAVTDLLTDKTYHHHLASIKASFDQAGGVDKAMEHIAVFKRENLG